MYDKFLSEGKYDNYKKIGTGGFLTEFGALDNSNGAAEEANRITANADKIFNSWTYW